MRQTKRTRPRVLVTDAEVRKTLAVVRGLGEDYEIITASARRPALAAWSRSASQHLSSPTGNSFTGWLLETTRRLSIDLLICPQEATLAMACSVYSDLQAAGVVLTFPPLETLDLAFDKAKTLELAATIGISAPPTAVPDRWQDADQAAETLGYPLVIKPRYSNFWTGTDWIRGRGSDYARDGDELTEALARLDRRQPPPILQKFVPGHGAAVFLLLDREGELRAHFAHRRLRDVRPTGSGSVLRESVATDPSLLDRSLELLRSMKWWGIAMVEYRIEESAAEPLLMEVNGRFWGSLQLSTDCGVNFPQLLAKVALGDEPQIPTYREGVAVRWWMGDLLRTLRVLKGRPKGFPGRFPSRWSAIRDLLGRQPAGTRNEVLRREDPWPAVAEILKGVTRLA